jgi:shikimate dehydrogenase
VLVSGTTRVAALLGYPATYSVSPALHNAAYESMGIDAVYVVFPTRPQNLPTAIASVRALNMLGVSVTIPHKEAVVALCDELSNQARALQAVNTIVNDNGKLVGHNTDGDGFVRSLAEELSFDPSGKRVVVIGAGGAAKAVIEALSRYGAAEIAVVNRSAARAAETATISDVARTGDATDISDADLVINATPLGMVGEHEGMSPVDGNVFRNGQTVVDLIYKPAQTQFLIDAAAVGAKTANGLGMLLHQAALQIELWIGQKAPVDVMKKAIA